MPPLPVPTLDNQEFWDGVRQHKLMIQRCSDCGTMRHYPRPACFNCGSLNYDYQESSGNGTIYSFIISYQSFYPYFDDKVPYNIVLVELDDYPGVRLASNLTDVENDNIQIGMPVSVHFKDLTDSDSIYLFRPR